MAWRRAQPAHVAAVGAEAEREHRRMLDDPQFVGRVGRARVGEGAHRGEDGVVVAGGQRAVAVGALLLLAGFQVHRLDGERQAFFGQRHKGRHGVRAGEKTVDVQFKRHDGSG
jgi:hypothetical protein